MTARLFFFSVTSALAGFLFGFDTVVISGAEKQIQSIWGLSDLLHGAAMGAALWGTVIGSLCGGWPTDRFGRRPTLIAIGFLYFVSAIWSALAPDVYSFMIARLIGGLGVGITTVAAPLYISEIAPPKIRGSLAGLFQFNIVFGIVVALLSNYLLSEIGPSAWRWMLGVEAAPALIYTALCLCLPESPRWLIGARGDRLGGRNVLLQIDPHRTDEEVNRLVEEIENATSEGDRNDAFFSTKLTRPILLAFLIAFFNQMSGINAIFYFAPRIFELAGLGQSAALLQSVGIGVTNLIFTFVGLWLIDRLGRRTLLLIGGFGYIASLGTCSWAFYNEHFSIIPACIFVFIASHAIGQGTVIWVFIAEIFPNRHRAAGQSLGSFTHWIFAALLTTLFPKMVSLFVPGTVFLFFCSMMMLQLAWIILFVPETKGVPLEEIERRMAPRQHSPDKQL
ncbi:D-xylose-proton symporter [Stratiformator vulcanicus]|uniref:D-xylose-proton symporter n=1 Tax=Stratiformator vulcanicus TaxID=2527980 RepID=A0A517QYD2_9PLAN|nr:D-xylose-proton symporter [Stratiformator vulcanicus]